MGRRVPQVPDDERPGLTHDEERWLRTYEAAIAEADFIQRWQTYGVSRTDAPRPFHRGVGIALVAAAVDRNRWLEFQHKTLYPGVFLLLLAGSGQRKSTALSYAENLVMSTLPDRHLASDYSPEALIADLHRRKPSRGIAIIDEAGRLFSTMRRDRFGEGLKDVLAYAWDAPERFERRLRKETFSWESTYLSIIGATTLQRFTETMTVDDVSTGFLARWLPVVATGPVERRPLAATKPDIERASSTLARDFLGMHRALVAEARAMPITEMALARLNAWEEALDGWASREFHAEWVQPWCRRLADYASRLALLFTVSEGADTVDRPQVLRAVATVDEAKDHVRMLVAEMAKDQAARERDKIERFITANPGISKRDLQRRGNLDARKVESVTQELVSGGRVHRKVEGPTTRYFPVLRPST